MTREAASSPSGGSGTGYSPAASDATVAPREGQQTAIHKICDALDQIGREVAIAQDTLAWCEDLEGTAYHLRRAYAHLKFASGALGDLRKATT